MDRRLTIRLTFLAHALATGSMLTRIPDMQITRADKSNGEMKTKFILSVYYEGDTGSKP